MRLLIVLLLWPVLLSAAESTVLPLRPAFTAEQREWLDAHSTLRVGVVMQAPWAQLIVASSACLGPMWN
jgi:hypothetical protein